MEHLSIVQRSYNDEGAIVEQSIVGRARSVTYKGNNKSGDWVMELYVETSPENDTDLTPEQIQQLKNAQDDGQTYSKNPNNSSREFGKAKYDKKASERKEKGLKDLKPFKAKTIKNEIQVNRKFIKVVALLNPNVKPQSPVATEREL